jgi:hypothetical protein
VVVVYANKYAAERSDLACSSLNNLEGVWLGLKHELRHVACQRTASTDNVAVAGHNIYRNGVAVQGVDAAGMSPAANMVGATPGGHHSAERAVESDRQGGRRAGVALVHR